VASANATAAHADPSRRVWPALLLAPSLALGHLSLAYALVSPACSTQSGDKLLALAAVSLLLTLAMTWHAWRIWIGLTPRQRPQVERRGTESEATRPEARSRFLALVATLSGAFSSLVIAAMTLPLWLLSPCG
jgi:hypothetical protein